MNTSTIAQSLGNMGKEYLVGVTKVLNNDSNPGLVDLFMDSAKGRGHRIVAGHDFTDLHIVFEKFGIEGVYDYFKHLSKDIMSPDGIPFPFAKQIQEMLGLSRIDAINWLCVNIGDVLSGGLSIWHTCETIQALNAEKNSQELVLKILVGSGIKVLFSLYNPNPISLVCGMIDFGALAYYIYPVYSNYVVALIQRQISSGEMLKNSAKHYISTTSKNVSIDVLVSGSSSLAADLSEKYFDATSRVKLFIANTKFNSLKIAIKKFQASKSIKNQDSIVNLDLIPSFL